MADSGSVRPERSRRAKEDLVIMDGWGVGYHRNTVTGTEFWLIYRANSPIRRQIGQNPHLVPERLTGATNSSFGDWSLNDRPNEGKYQSSFTLKVPSPFMRRVALAAIVLCSLPGSSLPVSGAEGLLGYYRQAALHGRLLWQSFSVARVSDLALVSMHA